MLLPYYMKFWRHVNLAILKNPDLAIFRKFWNIRHLIFAISQSETFWRIKEVFKTFATTIEH